jgi:polyisoprenoid-binding protein YceI
MTWEIDPARSHIGFTIRKLKLFTVHGSFTCFSGAIDLDETDLARSRVAVLIDAASIDTGIAKRDIHLRSPDFFDTPSYPTLTFRSTRVEQIDEGLARVSGELTIRDITRAVVLEVSADELTRHADGTSSVVFRATAIIRRHDWGVSWGRLLVGDTVGVTIVLAAVRPATATVEMRTVGRLPELSVR